MSKNAILSAAVFFVMTTAVSAAVEWEVSSGVLTISGSGPMDNTYTSRTIPWKDYNFSSVVIGSDISSIGKSAFCKLNAISSITFLGTNSILTIGDSAFFGTNISNIVLPGSTTNIGKYAFSGCTALRSISLPNSLQDSISTGCFQGCRELTSVAVPNNITTIGVNAFEGCIGLTSVVLPDNLRVIQRRAFYQCVILDRIVLPSALTNLDTYAFYQCGLTSITLPPSLTTTGSNIFEGCILLANVTVLKNQVLNYPTLPNTVRAIYVLPSLVSSYKGASGWTTFSSIIFPCSTTAALASLEVQGYTLSPEFDGSRTSYDCRIPYNADSVTIAAIAADMGTVRSTDIGVKTPNIGSNSYPIIVKAQDGSNSLQYTINIIRSNTIEMSNANLKNLLVNGNTVYPSFRPAVMYYERYVPPILDSVVITAIAEHSSAGISGAGKVGIRAGRNTFNIKVQSEDGTAVKTYVLDIVRGHAPTAVFAESAAPSLQLFPNPAVNGEFTITDTQFANGGRVEIYSINGILAMTANSNVINIRHLPAGVYIVRAGNKSAKVIKQ